MTARSTTKPTKKTGSDQAKEKKPSWWPVYRTVKRIPKGRVATYGQVAVVAGMPRQARQVGWALHALEAGSNVPWHRVINSRGEVSERSSIHGVEGLQRVLLEQEGVVFDVRGRVSLKRYQWRPRGWSHK